MIVLYYLCLNLAFIYVVLFVYLFTNTKRKTHSRILTRSIWKFNRVLDRCESSGDYHLPKRTIRGLKHTTKLEAFFQSCKRLGSEKRARLFIENRDAIIGLMQREKHKTIHAFFAYMMKDIDLSKEQGGGYGDLMLSFLTENSVYTRENALKAIYSFGDVKLVSDAFVTLSRKRISHNEKLLMDGLLAFHGDSDALARRLMLFYDNLLECYQNALINYLNYKSIDIYDEKFLLYARMSKVSVDTTCCIIRKLNKQKSERNLDLLKDLINRYDEQSHWEPVAIAVAGLGRYGDNEEVRAILKDEIVSQNWFIRRNAAASLVSIGVTESDLEDIYQRNDRFATDAIKYAMGRVEYA